MSIFATKALNTINSLDERERLHPSEQSPALHLTNPMSLYFLELVPPIAVKALDFEQQLALEAALIEAHFQTSG